jgi:hypothetical protein
VYCDEYKYVYTSIVHPSGSPTAVIYNNTLIRVSHCTVLYCIVYAIILLYLYQYRIDIYIVQSSGSRFQLWPVAIRFEPVIAKFPMTKVNGQVICHGGVTVSGPREADTGIVLHGVYTFALACYYIAMTYSNNYYFAGTRTMHILI